MKKFVIVLLAAVLFVFTSCEKVVGHGPLVTEIRTVPNFTGISSEMSGKVNFAIAPAFKVEITAQQNILEVVRTHVENGVLHIDFKNNVRVKEHEDLIINITAPSANYFRLSGSGNMDVTGDVVANNLDVELSGSGNISIQKAIVADKVDVDLSGSGNIKIASGSAINSDLNTSGSGKIDLAGVGTDNAVVKTTGSGDMWVSVARNLDVKITGSGSIYYHGNPIISTNISGSGRVIPF